MSYYRLYFRGGSTGGFTGVQELDAIDDVEASAKAEQYAGERIMELWCGTRQVRSFAPIAAGARATH